MWTFPFLPTLNMSVIVRAAVAVTLAEAKGQRITKTWALILLSHGTKANSCLPLETSDFVRAIAPICLSNYSMIWCYLHLKAFLTNILIFYGNLHRNKNNQISEASESITKSTLAHSFMHCYVWKKREEERKGEEWDRRGREGKRKWLKPKIQSLLSNYKTKRWRTDASTFTASVLHSYMI